MSIDTITHSRTETLHNNPKKDQYYGILLGNEVEDQYMEIER
jgi:hypothetical protein